MSPGRDDGRDDRDRVRIPADVERPDRLLAGLTARQLAILAVAAVALWAGYTATRHLVPVAVYGAVAIPIGLVAAMLALGRLEGVAADRWVAAAWRHHRAPHRLVPAPDGVPATPAFARRPARATAGAAASAARRDRRRRDRRPRRRGRGHCLPGQRGHLHSAHPGRAGGTGRRLRSLAQLARPRPSSSWCGPSRSTSAPPSPHCSRPRRALPHPALEAAARGHAAVPRRAGRAPGPAAPRGAGRAAPNRARQDAAGRLHRRAAEAAACSRRGGRDPGRPRRHRGGRRAWPAPSTRSAPPRPSGPGRHRAARHRLDGTDSRSPRPSRTQASGDEPASPVSLGRPPGPASPFGPDAVEVGPGRCGSGTAGAPASPSSATPGRSAAAGSSRSPPTRDASTSPCTSSPSPPTWPPTACAASWPASNRGGVPMPPRDGLADPDIEVAAAGRPRARRRAGPGRAEAVPGRPLPHRPRPK